MRPAHPHDSIRIAANLIDRHGLRAAAVASEHAAEAQASGDTAAVDHWLKVQSAIVELRGRTSGRVDGPMRT
ncbi:MAG TPA: hypothetical protein VHS58_14050 [Acetobacteraceae bacterium]|jgi:hypothetical protein|nr:hypothetical protein [Acetobacteraceae bacterium]